MPITLSILLGSGRIGRQSPLVARHILKQLNLLEGVQTRLLDLAEYNLPMMEQRLDEMDETPPMLNEFISALQQADGILIVSPEYKHGCPGILKNALDFLPPQFLRRKVVGICTVSSGGFGGINCLAQLRLICLALGALPIPAALPVSHVQDMFTPEGELLDEAFDGKLNPFLRELLWHTTALANHRRESEILLT